MQTFDFVAKYKSRKTNVVADALSRKYHLLSLLEAKVLGFEMIKPYLEDAELKDIHRKVFFSREIGCAFLNHP